MQEVKQFAPAKINLYLHILGRRTDGFHELETLMAPITLGDTLEIDLVPNDTSTPGSIQFTCSDPTLSDAQDNLATRAATLFREEFNLTTGIRIHLEKAVPVGAGLGGGSSDAAAVLLALRQLTGIDCGDDKLAALLDAPLAETQNIVDDLSAMPDATEQATMVADRLRGIAAAVAGLSDALGRQYFTLLPVSWTETLH